MAWWGGAGVCDGLVRVMQGKCISKQCLESTYYRVRRLYACAICLFFGLTCIADPTDLSLKEPRLMHMSEYKRTQIDFYKYADTDS